MTFPPAGRRFASCASLHLGMAKEKSLFVCSECGGTSPKWLGKCPSCGAWNTLIEQVAGSNGPANNRFGTQYAADRKSVV